MSKSSPAADSTACCPGLSSAALSLPECDRLAGLFKALSDPVRLCLFARVAAAPAGEACVCDIQDVGVSQPTVSHHLRKLREAGLLEAERRGTWIFYRVVPGPLADMASVLATNSTVRSSVVVTA
jgi:ArsR family transcriptional regulator